jgi:hypothetical protein
MANVDRGCSKTRRENKGGKWKKGGKEGGKDRREERGLVCPVSYQAPVVESEVK